MFEGTELPNPSAESFSAAVKLIEPPREAFEEHSVIAERARCIAREE